MTLSEAYVEHHCIAVYDAYTDEEKTPTKPACLTEDERCGEPALTAEKFHTIHERLQVRRLFAVFSDLFFDFEKLNESWSIGIL